MTTQSTLSPAIPTPTAPLFPKQGEWPFEHWLRFPEDGWKYEIIDGVLYMTPPPAIAHRDALGCLFARMRLDAEEKNLGQVLSAPCRVRLSTQPVPVEPDILFVRKRRLDIIGREYVEGTPDLIVEIISQSNGHYDRKTKFALYQEAGVTEYWLVDYQARNGASPVDAHNPC